MESKVDVTVDELAVPLKAPTKVVAVTTPENDAPVAAISVTLILGVPVILLQQLQYQQFEQIQQCLHLQLNLLYYLIIY